jgi:hypothetical protein
MQHQGIFPPQRTPVRRKKMRPTKTSRGSDSLSLATARHLRNAFAK